MKLPEIGSPNLMHDQSTVTSFCGSADAGAASTPPIMAVVAITTAPSPLMRVLIMEPPLWCASFVLLPRCEDYPRAVSSRQRSCVKAPPWARFGSSLGASVLPSEVEAAG